MNLILIILLITSVYFSARFFLLSKNIKESARDFKEILEQMENNRKLKISYPDKNFENLLNEINKYLEKSQTDKIRYMKREEEIRKDIENISHDLRTPLTSIRGYLELMNDESIKSEEKQAYISIVERRAKGLQNLIQTFYDLSRLESDNYNLNIEVIDINKELREQLLVFYNDFERKSISVNIDLCKEQAYVKLDKNAIERVFTNLIQNSIKYSKGNFRVLSYKKDKEIIIIFANDVQGLEKEEVKLLFNRFYMNDSSRNSKSSGLGLTITKFLVEAMGGMIKAEVEEGWIIFEMKFIFD
ncbi:MAG: HAMP domain-containing sensor histidine kinase [Peptostreptococcaceae bacterium]